MVDAVTYYALIAIGGSVAFLIVFFLFMLDEHLRDIEQILEDEWDD